MDSHCTGKMVGSLWQLDGQLVLLHFIDVFVLGYDGTCLWSKCSYLEVCKFNVLCIFLQMQCGRALLNVPCFEDSELLRGMEGVSHFWVDPCASNSFWPLNQVKSAWKILSHLMVSAVSPTNGFFICMEFN